MTQTQNPDIRKFLVGKLEGKMSLDKEGLEVAGIIATHFFNHNTELKGLTPNPIDEITREVRLSLGDFKYRKVESDIEYTLGQGGNNNYQQMQQQIVQGGYIIR